MHFSDLGLIEPIVRAVDAAGYSSPTPIQEQAIPVALDGQDILGCAQTGTGKTAAFGLPLAIYLLYTYIAALPKELMEAAHVDGANHLQVFRSLVLGLLGFVVSFVPVLCTLGLMAWFGLPVNIATCILGGVVVGLAVDDTIYFLSRVREGILPGVSVDNAVRRATWTTGRAMIKTLLILTGGFLTMAASDFMPSVYFGIFFAFSILVALLADLIVLPFFLRLAQPFLRQR